MGWLSFVFVLWGVGLLISYRRLLMVVVGTCRQIDRLMTSGPTPTPAADQPLLVAIKGAEIRLLGLSDGASALLTVSAAERTARGLLDAVAVLQASVTVGASAACTVSGKD